MASTKAKASTMPYGQATCELIVLGATADKLMLAGDLHVFDELKDAFEYQYSDMPPMKYIEQMGEQDFYKHQARLRARFNKYDAALEEQQKEDAESKNGQTALLILSHIIQSTFDDFDADVLEPNNPCGLHALTMTHDEFKWGCKVHCNAMPSALQVSFETADNSNTIDESLREIFLPLINLTVIGYIFGVQAQLPEDDNPSDEVEGVKGEGISSVRNVLATLSYLYGELTNENEMGESYAKDRLAKFSEVLGSDLSREFFNISDGSEASKSLDDGLNRIQAAARHVQKRFDDPCYKATLEPIFAPLVFTAEIVEALCDTVFTDDVRDSSGELHYINVWVVDGDMWKFRSREKDRGEDAECSVNNMDFGKYLEVSSEDSGIQLTYMLLDVILPVQIILHRLRAITELLKHNERVVAYTKSVASILGGNYEYCLNTTAHFVKGLEEGGINDTNIHQELKRHFKCSEQKLLDIATVLSAPTLSSTVQ